MIVLSLPFQFMLAHFLFKRQHEHLRRSDTKSRYAFTTLEMGVVLFFLVITAALVLPMVFNGSVTVGVDVTKSQLIELRNALTRYWADVKYASVATGLTVYEFSQSESGGIANALSIRCLFSNPDLDRDGSPDGDISAYDSGTKIGWNGPYLLNTPKPFSIEFASHVDFAPYGQVNDLAIYDVIGPNSINKDRKPMPIVVQALFNNVNQTIDVRIVSAGEDGVIKIAPDATNESINLAAQQGFLEIVAGDDLYEMFTLRP